jgi:hypothetical protein
MADTGSGDTARGTQRLDRVIRHGPLTTRNYISTA